MISYKNSKKILKKGIIKIQEESILSINSLNRVSSSNIYSKFKYPACNNAAFDGFAINSNDTKKINNNKSKLFKIIGSITAGKKPFTKQIKKFQTVEIMTGGVIPKGLDTIVPIEQIDFYPDKKKRKFIIIKKKVGKYNHVRFSGSDFKKNELVIKKNTIIQSNHILAFKTLGIKNVKVKKKINILFFSTGNEISNNNSIPDWKVRNSNIHYIKNLNENFLFNFKNGGILRDHEEKTFKLIIKKELKSKINIILTSGAVSAGKHDYVPNVIKDFKSTHHFKNVAIRPGKPVLFTKIKAKQKAFFGLPGNPISSAACFRFFVYPYILILLGLKDEKPIKATLKNDFSKKKNFTRFVKCKLSTTKNGKIQAQILRGQESFRIKSFIKSNIWAILPSGKSRFKRGEIVDCFFSNCSNQTFL